MRPAANVVVRMASFLFALHAPVFAQDRSPDTYMEMLRKAETAAPALPADVASEKLSEESRAMLKRASHQLQTLATTRALVGDTEGAIAAFDLVDLKPDGHRPIKADERKAIEDGTVEDAIQAIVAAASTRRVVLINEAHHVSMHRAFAHKLAIELRKIGYTYFAAELLSKPHANAPFVLCSKEGGHTVLHGMAKYVDMQVVFPRYTMRHGRPEWLDTLSGRTPQDIPSAMLPVSGRRLIQAYRISSGPGAVPTDNVLVEAGKPVPKLMLPKGEFQFAFDD